MHWFRRSAAPRPAPDPFADTPFANDIPVMAYEDPPRGEFDHPHRIRDKALLDEAFKAPLPAEAVARALRHHEQSAQVRRGAEEVSWLEGMEAAEIWDPTAIEMAREHQRRKVSAEITKQIQTPFIQRMIALQMTAQRWKKKITK